MCKCFTFERIRFCLLSFHFRFFVVINVECTMNFLSFTTSKNSYKEKIEQFLKFIRFSLSNSHTNRLNVTSKYNPQLLCFYLFFYHLETTTIKILLLADIIIEFIGLFFLNEFLQQLRDIKQSAKSCKNK